MRLEKILRILKEDNLLIDSVFVNGIAEFNNVETDSRKVNQNDIFVCITGFETDGHKFAKKAVQNGAKLLIVEKKLAIEENQIIVKSSRKAAALIAKIRFDNPTSKFKLIGITGTNGKTTTSQIIYKILINNEIKCGSIGTLGYFINEKKHKLERTTPDIIQLNQIFAEMAQSNLEIVIMEVSSHAIALDRIYGLEFDIVNFTNLTQDHLDFHKDINEYFHTKLRLFQEFKFDKAFINSDDKYGKIISQNIDNVSTFGFEKSEYQIDNYKSNVEKTQFSISNIGKFDSKLIGKFNSYNITMAILNIIELRSELSISAIKKSLLEISNIDGRITKVDNQQSLNVFVDYAHTPDALENVLSTLKSIPHKRLICVFGAGGNRDKSKRPLMMDAVTKFSDVIIVTSDNPRNEKPEDIINEIVAQSKNSDKVFIERDRKLAIELALKIADENDIVLVAGKGQETYQEINNHKIHFDDAETIQNLLKEKFNYTEQSPNTATVKLPFNLDVLNLELWFSAKIEDVKFINTISTDSRNIKQNTLFFAIKGDKFDGHQYVNQVIEDKSNLAIVSNNEKKSRLINVENTKTAYQLLAKKYRILLGTQIVALTGSTGKTSMKEYCKSIFSQKYKIISTYKNENNTIGVPKTIFRLRPDTEFAIIEIGTNHFGELKESADCLIPDYAIINNIGACHLEFFKDLDGVFAEKSQLFERSLKLKLFGEQKYFQKYQSDGKSIGFNDCDYKISNMKKDNNSISFELNNEKFMIDNSIEHNVINSSFAISLAKEIGIDNKTIQVGLTGVNIEGRMEIVKSDNYAVIFDCYNANPVSMTSAIKFWKEYLPEKKHIAILGDMLELGTDSEKYHKQIGEILDHENELIYGVGNDAKFYNPHFHFKNIDEMVNSNFKENINNSIILVKGSHGINLERLKREI